MCACLSLTYSLSLFLSRCLSIRLSIYFYHYSICLSIFLFAFFLLAISLYLAFQLFSHSHFLSACLIFFSLSPILSFSPIPSVTYYSVSFYCSTPGLFLTSSLRFGTAFGVPVTSTLHTFVSDFFCHA